MAFSVTKIEPRATITNTAENTVTAADPLSPSEGAVRSRTLCQRVLQCKIAVIEKKERKALKTHMARIKQRRNGPQRSPKRERASVLETHTHKSDVHTVAQCCHTLTTWENNMIELHADDFEVAKLQQSAP